ncbi:MAG: TPM domain-containing protein [Nitrospinaceae bacterium]|nr:MAG: TPM domain-containing protein [Nitrospinaceae bacterium]
MRRSSIFTKALLAALLLVAVKFAVDGSRDRRTQPAPDRVVDEAGLMTPGQAARLSEYHRFLLKDHDIDYRVLTTNSAGEVNAYSIEKFEELGVGGESRTGRGLLLVIDVKQDAVRLEVGRALEGMFTDAFITYVQHRQMVPFFRDGRVADGILATTELIYTEAQKAEKNAGFDPREQDAVTAGGGAATRARIGEGNGTGELVKGGVAAGGSPEATVMAYLGAMAERNANPDLDLFTEGTRKMLAGWTVTPAQMDNIVQTYRACHAEPVKVGGAGKLAVVRYPPAERQCSPWFLREEKGGWRLDLTMMQKAVRFGRTNAWHFDLQVEHPYRFAFEDWRFDRHGFPVVKDSALAAK